MCASNDLIFSIVLWLYTRMNMSSAPATTHCLRATNFAVRTADAIHSVSSWTPLDYGCAPDLGYRFCAAHAADLAATSGPPQQWQASLKVAPGSSVTSKDLTTVCTSQRVVSTTSGSNSSMCFVHVRGDSSTNSAIPLACLVVVVPNVHIAAVQIREQPGVPALEVMSSVRQHCGADELRTPCSCCS